VDHGKNFPPSHPYGVNFGISLSLWDYLFKTAHVPYDGASIELGYPGDEEMPEDFSGQAIFPFSRKKPVPSKDMAAKEENIEV
jgi:sterol desaturase/sphingolipid hydroxylase (fatty acid hydroxylase superfamily)